MDEKLDARSLFDELSATYDTTGIDFFDQIARQLVNHARLRKGAVVLDLGCGAGAALPPASETVGAGGRVLGIDLAAGMVERARGVVKELGLENVQVEVGDAESPAAPPGSVDAIIASLVLFFLPSIGRALDAYAQALTEGGTLAFSTFVDDDDWTHLDQLLAGFASESSREQEQQWFESPGGIRSLLSSHGFRDISIEEVTHHVHFPTIAAFHEWAWSTGWRAELASIPSDQRDTARAAVDDYLRSLQKERGTLRLETHVRYTRASAS